MAEPEISSQEVVPLLLLLCLKLLVVPNPFLQEPQAQGLQPVRRAMPRRPEIKTLQVGINPYPVTLHALVRVVEERKFRVQRVLGGPSWKTGEPRLDLPVPYLLGTPQAHLPR